MNGSGPSLGRRIARNTALFIAGELASRVATFVLFAVMARELGLRGFGDFTFALSIVVLLVLIAGLSAEDIVTRTVARDPGAVDRVLADAFALRLAGGALAVIAAVGVGIVGGYETALVLTLAFVALGGLFDLVSATVYAVFQGLDDLAPQAAGRALLGILRGAGGTVLLLAGAGVVSVAVVYAVSSALVLAWAMRRLAGRIRPRYRAPSISGAMQLALTSLPIAVWSLLEAGIVAATTVLLSALEGNAAVGLFGAATRLVDSSFAIAPAFVAAAAPMMARAGRAGAPPLRDAFEGSAKVLVIVLTPLSIGFFVFAEPITRLVFGSSFLAAAPVVRILAATVVLDGLALLSSYALVGQGRQRSIPWIVGSVAAITLVLAAILVPSQGAEGAAIATLVGAVLYAALAAGAALRLTGSISARRVLVSPALGGVGMVVAVGIVGTGVVGAIAAAIAYLILVVVIERWLSPADLSWAIRTARARSSAT